VYDNDTSVCGNVGNRTQRMNYRFESWVMVSRKLKKCPNFNFNVINLQV